MKAISDILSVRHWLFLKNFISRNAEEHYIVRMADNSILIFDGNSEILPDAIKEFIDSHIRKLVCAGEGYTVYEWTKSE